MPPKISSQKKLVLALSAGVAALLLAKKHVPPVLEKAIDKATSAVRDMSLPRGLRNNNPLNLRKGVNWAGRDGDDGAFDIFKSMDYGIRAGLQNLRTQHKRGYNTVAKLIGRWAPASDGNNVKKYVDFVSKNTPISPNEIINLNDKETLSAILYAMAQVENGPDITKKKLSVGNFRSVVAMY